MSGYNDKMNSPGLALILEDHEDARAWLSAAVTAAFPGVELAQCPTLESALSELDRQVPWLAIVDLQLPDGSGLRLIERLSVHRDACTIVVTTVFEDDAHVFAALRAGAQGYLLKDEPQASVVTMLAGIIEGRPALSPKIARRVLDHFHRAAPEVPEASLTEREQDVLALLAKGFTVKKVADLLEISPNTAAGYVKTIYRKLQVSSRAEATLEARRRGLIGDQSL
ncbi:MAG: response regulator transcription factor [Pseudomonadaceae bacterium]|nr:response regulator transcription factor [Pseudomonadaceae bacterium]